MNLANLAMVTGHIGVEYAGVNPLRGQNNVQGSCDMGALPNVVPRLPVGQRPSDTSPSSSGLGVKLSDKMGLRIPEMLDMAVYGKLKAMYVMGEDPALTDADANHVRKALDSLEFLVAQNLFMTETAKYADVFLPAACYAEKDGTFTNTERRVQRVRKAVEPPGQCRADWEIIADLSCRLGHEMRYDSPEEVFDEMRSLVPSYAGITYERIEKSVCNGPAPTSTTPAPSSCTPARFTRGKGLLQGIEYEAPAELCSDEYPILLTTGRMLLPLQHHDPALREPRGAAAARAGADQPGRRRNDLASERGRSGAGHVAPGLDHDPSDDHRPGP